MLFSAACRGEIMAVCTGSSNLVPELAAAVLKLAVASGQEAPYVLAYNNYVMVMPLAACVPTFSLSLLPIHVQHVRDTACCMQCMSSCCARWRYSHLLDTPCTQAGFDPGALAPLVYTPNAALINETFRLTLNPNISLATLQCAPLTMMCHTSLCQHLLRHALGLASGWRIS
jgi:hypothetical protein